MFLLLWQPPHAQAANISVNATCSLADAITAANTDTATGGCPAGSGDDTITLTANITLSAALPEIASTITVEGTSSKYTIDGADSYQIFRVGSSGSLTVNRLELNNGNASDPSVEGGAINNAGTLTVTDSSFSHNYAEGNGGAIRSSGPLTVTDSSFSHNSTDEDWVGGGGAIAGNRVTVTNSSFSNNSAGGGGGAIHTLSTLIVRDSSFTDNYAGEGAFDEEGGGAINTSDGHDDDAFVTVTNSSFTNNSTDGDGGAIVSAEPLTVTNSSFRNNSTERNGIGGAIAGGSVTVTVTVTNSSFSNNSAKRDGSGGAIASSSLTVTNSSFRNNSADGRGGAILGGNVNVTNSSFINNSAQRGGALYTRGRSATVNLSHVTITGNNSTGEQSVGGIETYDVVDFQIINSIIYGNVPSDCSGTPDTNSGNIIGTGCGPPYSTADPLLGSLITPADGSPPYIPLLAGSPAIDAVTCPTGVTTDQRGTTRPQSSACDIGAYEYDSANPPPTPTPTMNITVNSTCSLADAITAANTDTATGGCPAGSGDDTITLTADITLSAALPNITSTITVEGTSSKYTIDGADSFRIFYVDRSGSLTVNRLQLNNAYATDGLLIVGGAILNEQGTLNVTNSSFSHNSTTTGGEGGAIGNFNGTLAVTDSSFSNNSAGGGGAIASRGGTFTVRDSSFSNNSAIDGGAIFSTSPAGVTNSSFINNSATRYGGALAAGGGFSSPVIISHVTMTGNNSTMTDSSGGVSRVGSNVFQIINSIIYGNAPSDCVAELLRHLTNSGNIIGTGTCGTPYSTADPLLGSLASPADGSPPYIPLLAGSPAIDAVTCLTDVTTDQRGTTRPQGSACDIGAHEYDSASPPPTPTPTATIDPNATPTFGPSPTATTGPSATPTPTDVPGSHVLLVIAGTEITYDMVFGSLRADEFYPGVSPDGMADVAEVIIDYGLDYITSTLNIGYKASQYVASRLLCMYIDFAFDELFDFAIEQLLNFRNIRAVATALGFGGGAATGGSTGATGGSPAGPPGAAVGGAAGGGIVGAIKSYVAQDIAIDVLVDFLLDPLIDDLVDYIVDEFVPQNFPGQQTVTKAAVKALIPSLKTFIKGGSGFGSSFFIELGSRLGLNITKELAEGLLDWLLRKIGLEPIDCGVVGFISDVFDEINTVITNAGNAVSDSMLIITQELLDDERYFTEDPRAKLQRFVKFAETAYNTDLSNIEEIEDLIQLVCSYPEIKFIGTSLDAGVVSNILVQRRISSIDELSPEFNLIYPSEIIQDMLCHPVFPRVVQALATALCLSPNVINLTVLEQGLGIPLGFGFCQSLLSDLAELAQDIAVEFVEETSKVVWSKVDGVTHYVLRIRTFSSPASRWKTIIVRGNSYQLTKRELPSTADGFQVSVSAINGALESEPVLYPADPNDPTQFMAQPAVIIHENVPLPPTGGGGGESEDGFVASGERAEARARFSTCDRDRLPANFAVAGHNAGTQCNVLNNSSIGHPDLAGRFIAGLDVWSYVGAGIEVCIRGSGAMRFVDTSELPRSVRELMAYSDAGMTCAGIDRVGQVVLVPGPPAPPLPTPGPLTFQLVDCMVTLTHVLNFREGPGGDVKKHVDGTAFWLPHRISLTAFERTADWFYVDYHGERGWISADYVEISDGCLATAPPTPAPPTPQRPPPKPVKITPVGMR